MPDRSWRCSTLFHQRSPQILDHRRFLDKDAGARAEEVEERGIGAGNVAGERTPSQERSWRPPCVWRRGCESSLELFAALKLRAGEAGGARETGVDRCENPLRSLESLGERQQERLDVQRGGGAALGLGIKTTRIGLDLVTEEIDAHRAVHLGRVDVQNARREE